MFVPSPLTVPLVAPVSCVVPVLPVYVISSLSILTVPAVGKFVTSSQVIVDAASVSEPFNSVLPTSEIAPLISTLLFVAWFMWLTNLTLTLL